MAQVDAMAAALDSANGPLLAFCRIRHPLDQPLGATEAKRGGDPDVPL
jgi:protein tyrosine phosphatase (PTP) superfamily phosphohydrolase (DUF442 family)